MMRPLTSGAIPMKFARTVASLVSARFSHCHMVTTTAATAHTRMSAPTTRPTTRRHPGDMSLEKAVGSATEHAQREDQCDEERQARIHERSRPQIRVDSDAREDLPAHDGAENADHEGDHPGREV